MGAWGRAKVDLSETDVNLLPGAFVPALSQATTLDGLEAFKRQFGEDIPEWKHLQATYTALVKKRTAAVAEAAREHAAEQRRLIVAARDALTIAKKLNAA